MAYLRCHSGLPRRRTVIVDGPVRVLLRLLADDFRQLPLVLIQETV